MGVNSGNLHSYGNRSGNRQTRRSSWGVRPWSSTMDNFRNLNVSIGVEVRNSASGGWHGTYDDDQLQAIKFDAPLNKEGGEEGMVNVRNSASGGWHGVYDRDDDLLSQDNIGVVSPDGLREIEDGLDNYMDEDVSDDVEFMMEGIGSDKSIT